MREEATLDDDLRRRRRALANAAVAVWLLLFAGATLLLFFRIWLPQERAKEAQPLPDHLGPVRLVETVEGPAAMAQVAKLHGKDIALANAYVGHYEEEGARATVYVSISRTRSDAASLYKLMTVKIGKGNAVFTGLRKATTTNGLEGYSLQGMGQEHFYYLKDKEVVWVAADPTIAGAVLDAAQEQVR